MGVIKSKNTILFEPVKASGNSFQIEYKGRTSNATTNDIKVRKGLFTILLRI